MLQEVQATLTWAIPSFRRQTNKITSPVFGPGACTWELSLYPEGHGQTRDTHMGLFLDVVKTEVEKAQGEAWCRPITSFRLSVMKRDTRTPVVMKEREPAGQEGFGKGFSHPRSWGWAALLPLNRLSEAATSDGTLIVHAEVVWQQRAELVGLLELQNRDVPSSGGLLFNWRLADVTFVVAPPSVEESVASVGTIRDAKRGSSIQLIDYDEQGGELEEEDVQESVMADQTIRTTGTLRKAGVMTIQDVEADDGQSIHVDDESAAESSGLGYYEESITSSAPDHKTPGLDAAAEHLMPSIQTLRSPVTKIPEVFDRPSSTTSSTASLPTIPIGQQHPPTCTNPSSGFSSTSSSVTPSTVIPAHRAILASRSDYFSAMFSSGLREAGGADFSQPSVVEIHDFSAFAVRAMLEFIYTGRLLVPPADLSARSELIRLSDRYQLSQLHNYIGAMVLEKDLTLDVALEILELADVYSSASGELKTACLGYVRENIGKLKIRDSFKNWVRSTDRRDLMVELFALM
ncbi:hypothetical protein HKX48_008295 [Thoreauomyces humboldtii]|nr:hypothetical protein HKX48_008295 [Thoreauomyces humboldtii]